MNIADVLRKYEKQLMLLPNVSGVGIGEKSGKEVILVFVRVKVPVPALHPSGVIPSMLDGYETDVQEEIRVG